ncbi:MAG: DUF3891 family protein [Candidatus Sumerlaeaceae bacterium]
MIRRRWGKDKWMLVPQAEHARVAGVIAAAWKFSPVRPNGEVIKAIAMHDDGWAEYDATPHLNGRGEPRSFLEMPKAEHYAIWSRSVALIAEQGLLYGACVVAQYFVKRALGESEIARLSPREAVALGKFLAEQEHRLKTWSRELEKRAESLEEALPTNPNDTATASLASVPVGGTFEDDVRLLEVCDALSILLCTDFQGTTTIANVPYLAAVDQLTVRRPNGKFGLEIEPLPFRKNLRDHVRAYIISANPYENDEQLQTAIQAGMAVSHEFLLAARSEDISVA